MTVKIIVSNLKLLKIGQLTLMVPGRGVIVWRKWFRFVSFTQMELLIFMKKFGRQTEAVEKDGISIQELATLFRLTQRI